MFNKLKSKKRENVFKNYYKCNLWGGENGKFYSGSGSYQREYVEGYADFVKEFVKRNNIHSIVDLGCGDYHVAAHFANDIERYIGIDIVADLIDENCQNYGNDRISFLCLDIVNDSLPDGDLCLIRQVLQHCTNSEIVSIMQKCRKYKRILVTEHVWIKEKASEYNHEISADRRTRRVYKSGVYLEEFPFNYGVTIVKRWNYGENEELLMYLIENSAR